MTFFYYFACYDQNVLNIFFFVVNLVILIIVNIYETFQIDLIKQNFIILTITVSIFAEMSAYNYMAYR